MDARRAHPWGLLPEGEGWVSAKAADVTPGVGGTLAAPIGGAPAQCLRGLHVVPAPSEEVPVCSAFEKHQGYGLQDLIGDLNEKKKNQQIKHWV